MAIVFDAPVTPDALTMFIRSVPAPFAQSLGSVLPVKFFDSDTINIAEIVEVNRVAQFRAYDSRIHVSQRDSGSLKVTKLPPLSDSLPMGEYERLQIEFARTQGTNKQAFVNAIYNDAVKLTNYVNNRMELARGDVLTDGKFTLVNEGGLTMEADFGVPPGNIVTAATLWSNPGATIIQELSTWVQSYVDLNGQPPTGMITSTAVVNALLRNTEIRALAATVSGSPAIVARGKLAETMAAYSLPPITSVYDTAVDVDGVTTKVIPPDKVVLYSEGLGYTAWGITATALELVNSDESSLSFAEAPGIVGVVDKSGPPYRQFTFVDAAGMPVIEQPRKLMIGTVL